MINSMAIHNTFIDLFAGIGGFRIGLERVGFKCVFSSEIDEECQKVYLENFNEIPYGDIRNINPNDIPDFDVLCAGFPCQPFSISGKKRGFNDTRGTLFFEICRVIEHKKPKTIFLENVKHLIYHDKKRTINLIIASLEELGYHVSHFILNAKDFGVPQNRERLIIIGSKLGKFNKDSLCKQTTPLLRDFLDEGNGFEYLDKSEYTLIDKPKKQNSGLLFVGYRNKNTWKIGVRPNTNHLSRVHRQPNRIYSIDGVHPTIPSQEPSGRFFIYIPELDKVRRLTINECYRIMGFPNDFKKTTLTSESYKQIGNSICVNMVEEIAKQIRHNKEAFIEPHRKITRDIQ